VSHTPYCHTVPILPIHGQRSNYRSGRLPIYEIWVQATKSPVAATIFVGVLGFFVNYVVLVACQHTASRLTWAFARDNALVFSHKIGHIHDKHEVPVWALLANSFVVFLLGFVYLGSSTAFNAFIGVGLILQQVAFAIPAMLLLVQRRSTQYLKPSRFVKLGPFGWFANVVTIAYGLLTLVFYCFPAYLPVSGGTMSEFIPNLPADLNQILLTPTFRLQRLCSCGNGSLWLHQLVSPCQKTLCRTTTVCIFVMIGLSRNLRLLSEGWQALCGHYQADVALFVIC